jgi:hypothetical protein
MSEIDNEIMKNAEDDARAVAFIQNYLPQALKEAFSEDQLYYFIDTIAEYYTKSGVLDVEPDSEGYIDIDEEQVADFLAKQAKKDNIGDFEPSDLYFVVEAEMEFAEQEDEEEEKDQ